LISLITNLLLYPFNGRTKTAKQWTLYSNTVIGTLAVDGWAVHLVQRGRA